MNSDAIRVGEHIHRTSCRLCKSPNMAKFLDLGYVPSAGGFLRQDEISYEKFYPLEVYFCRDCSLVQVNNAIPNSLLFGKYFYFSSAIKTLVDHFAAFAQELTHQFLVPGKSFAVELGSNDGVLLKPLQDLGVKCTGVDPATNVAEFARSRGIDTINDFFTEKVALEIRDRFGQADVVLSSNSFAHIEDLFDVMKGVKALLKDDGVFIVEAHYVGTLVAEMQYDMIYHEHLNYYSMTSLSNFFRRFDMEIFHIRKIPIHAGSMRYYVRNVSRRTEPISKETRQLLNEEQNKRLGSLETYVRFAHEVESSRKALIKLLSELKGKGKRIAGYGASGRATAIMNYCGIDSQYLDYVVDDAPAKQGYFTPGTHLQIRPWSATEASKPDYVLVFAWSFIDEIKRKRIDFLNQGGRFIVPLPDVRIISQ